MTTSYLGAVTFAGDQTVAIPSLPIFPSAQKAATIIGIAAALAISPTSATAATLGGPTQAFRLASRWTNSGDVVEDADTDHSFASAVLELRRRSGLTWEQLASLFDVDRRSLHLWASGRPMSAPNAERLDRILAVLRRAGGTPSATKAWLYSPTSQGIMPLDLLREGRFDEIALPGTTALISRPGPLSRSAKDARAPSPPGDLIGARHDRAHIEEGKLMAALPLKVSKSK